MSFHTRQHLAYVPPTAVFRTRNGRLVHQPVLAGGVRGLGDISLVPTGIQNTAPGLPRVPTMKVENTRMRIAQEETLRLAPAGPGLPGSFMSSSALRNAGSGRSAGGAGTQRIDVGVDPAIVGQMAAGIYNAAQSIIGCSGEAWCHKGSYELVSSALRTLRPNTFGLLTPERVRATLLALGPERTEWVDRALARNGTMTIAQLVADIDAGRYAGRAVSTGPSLDASALSAGLMRSQDFVLRSGGDVAPSSQPTGTGIMPTLSAEEMDRLRAQAGLGPTSTASDFMQGLSFGQIAGAITGFAVGLGLLLLRRK